jgi:hypothetical protein
MLKVHANHVRVGASMKIRLDRFDRTKNPTTIQLKLNLLESKSISASDGHPCCADPCRAVQIREFNKNYLVGRSVLT